MKIIIDGIEPQFKIYKMSESIDNKFYIGKTKQSLKDRMNGHRHGGHACIQADNHFADVGWRNVIVEIVDTANDEEELDIKEIEHITKHFKENKHNMLNKKIPIEVKQPIIQVDTYLVRVWSDVEKRYVVKNKNEII